MHVVIILDNSRFEVKVWNIFVLLVNAQNNHKENPIEDQEEINLCYFCYFIGTISQLGKNDVHNRAE